MAYRIEGNAGVKRKETRVYNKEKWNSPIFSTFLYVGYSMLFVC